MQIIGNKLIADDGMMMTNGKTYAKAVHLGIRAVPAEWWEVTNEEAEAATTDVAAEEALEELREVLT